MAVPAKGSHSYVFHVTHVQPRSFQLAADIFILYDLQIDLHKVFAALAPLILLLTSRCFSIK